MPSTYSALNYHLVFSTKNRDPFIEAGWRNRLHAYLGGIVKGLGGAPMSVGGASDHVHILLGPGPTHCIADVVRDNKKDSSSFCHNELRIKEFSWQEGYAIFSLSVDGIPAVRTYISGQEDHHKRASSRDELLALCKAAGIEPEMKYFD